MIICATCNEGYKPIFVETNQGEGCAAVVYLKEGKHFLEGHYGSYVADMRRFELKPSDSYKVGTICDECIKKLKTDDVIVNQEDVIW